MTLAPGARLGAYEIVAALGAGGMGEVYRARDTKLGRDVALKFLPDAFVADAERVARFRREAQVLGALNHQHIGQIYGLEEFPRPESATPTLALVLELVDGESLADRLARGALPIDEVLAIARQVAEALQSAHERGIVHRDLKPANIAITRDGVAKVLDFGLAKAVDPVVASSASISPTLTFAGATQAGMILGTAAYMSPEQAKGRAADKRSDVWAFGCVLYEMLTGRRAFDGDDVSDVLASVIKSEPDWSAFTPDTPLAIRTLVQRCLVKDRAKRIADLAVAEFLLGEPPLMEPPLAAPISGARARRRIPASVAVVAAAFIGATVAGITMWRLIPATPHPVGRFVVSLPEGRTFVNITRNVVAVSPDGTQMVFGADSRLYLRPLSDVDAQAIPGTDARDGVDSPVFSPDGRSLAFHSVTDNTLKRIALGGGAPVTICSATPPYGMSWSGDVLVYSQGREGIWRVPANGGRSEQIVKMGENEIAWGPQLLAGGDVLYTLATGPRTQVYDRWDAAQIVVQSIASGARTIVINGASDARLLPTGHLVYALGGTVFAVSYDARRHRVIGGPVPVIDGVRRTVSRSTGVAHFAVSDTGTLVYVPGPSLRSTRDRSIAVSDERSGTATTLPLTAAPYARPRVSRDGKRLTIATDDGREAIVWVYDLGGSAAIRRLTFAGRNRAPVWSADGSRITFQSDREKDVAIYWQLADGTGEAERLTKPDAGVVHVPEAWSPDGKTLLFTSVKDGLGTLWTISLPDKRTAPFDAVQSREPIDASFSPDGRWIVYASNDSPGGQPSPNRGVYIQPVPPTGARFQMPKELLDFHPAWSRDGRELLYVPTVGRLSIVAVQTQPTVTFGTPAVLPSPVMLDRVSTEPRDYDVLPDGRFIGTIPAGSEAATSSLGTPQIRVVINWIEELKARVPTR